MVAFRPEQPHVPAAELAPSTWLGNSNSLELQPHDEALILQLEAMNEQKKRYHSIETGLYFNTPELAGLVRKQYDTDSLAQLEEHLMSCGTLQLPVIEGHTVTVDGIDHKVTLLAATETDADGVNHGDMSAMIYLRDQIQAASAMMKLYLLDQARYNEQGSLGKKLLISSLHLLSTPDQLQRFKNVIALGQKAGQADWPHISLPFSDLEARRPNGWRNKQDTVQMLAYTTLEAIEQGFISEDDLAAAHKQMLGAIVPFLTAVGFPRYENSGSWEEVTAVRTSVMAIETALLDKLQTLAQTPGLEFLETGYNQAGPQLKMGRNFPQAVAAMVMNGLTELGRRLPFESPEYPQGSVKYREADAALAYVLRYNVPQLLAQHNIPMAHGQGQPMTVHAIEAMVLERILKLQDPKTRGIMRYEGDSYQRTNFHTNAVRALIEAIKRKVKAEAVVSGGEIDLDEKQRLRNTLTPQGQSPAWTHPLSQTASPIASRCIEEYQAGNSTAGESYEAISTCLLNDALTTITGENDWNAALDKSGSYRLKPVPQHKLPECHITYAINEKTFTVPSPHTPLNWSTALLWETIGTIAASIAMQKGADHVKL
ncbi:MAG TPA: hypothetical protein VFZ58_04915 [Candidatus Saccharimonadales bacterium]